MTYPRNSRPPPTAARRRQRGTVLLVAITAVVIIAAFAAALLTSSSAEMKQAKTTRAVSDVRTLAEGATVAAEHAVLVAVANTIPPPATGVLHHGPNDVPWSTQHIGTDTVEADAVGIQTIHQHWLVQSTADLAPFKHTVNRVLDVGLTPIFQYAIFYNPDLELLPGPSMTISGRVHTNADLYVGVGAGNTLTIKSDYFRSVGDMFRMRKDDGSLSTGSVKIQKSGTTSLYDMWSQSQFKSKGVPSTSGFDSQFKGFDANGDGDLSDMGDWPDFAVGALSTWGGTVQSADHGVKPVEPPSIGSIKRFQNVGAGNGDYAWNATLKDYSYVGMGSGDSTKGRYHATADLVIRDLKAYDNKGTAISMPVGAIASRSFYDAREGKTVTVTQIDLKILRDNGLMPANGEIYASRSDATVSQPNGIRLVNGAELGQPLTVVTEDPLYVRGDYNTVNKKPAAVIADAVNLLSNSWDDKKTKGTLPKAKATVFDMAMITGGDETGGAGYSGGFENLPRFHENWDGVNASILGSFVKIYASELAKGKWVYGGDHYTAPNRLWDYDTSFNKVENLPPFTPNVAQVRSSGWWD
jgi:hypothetical protein